MASNLEFALTRLSKYAADTVDVLLYFHLANGQVPDHVISIGIPPMPVQFEVVALPYEPLNVGGYFEILP